MIKCERYVQEVLGPGIIWVPDWDMEYPRWPRYITLATCPADILPGLAAELPTPEFWSELPIRISRRKNAGTQKRSPAWVVEWDKTILFEDGSKRASLHFVDSTFGEAYPRNQSPNPEADSETHTRWSCSLSAFNYVAFLFNRVLKEESSPVKGAGRGYLQAVKDQTDEHGHVVGKT